jgi:predicted ATPase/DNA-binding CsgD family transcriptional regulator
MDPTPAGPPLEPLTERELDVLRLLAAGLSDAAIAAHLVLSVTTIKWYNRQLYTKLAVSSRTQAVARAGALGLLPAVATPSAPPRRPGNLPAPTTSFIGRQEELATIARLLRTSRLVTLTGPGGSGKTRLVIEAAGRLAEHFPDGLAFVSLAPLAAPDLVGKAIAQQLGVGETAGRSLHEALASALGERRLLLVLDNFEHLLPAAPLVGELLAQAPGLKVLATSREALHLYGEHELRVLPLSLPQPGEDGQQLANEAMLLFAARAQAAAPGFALTTATAPLVAAICRRLDGLPLAIELAAAQLGFFSLEELHGRLADRLGTLAGGPRDAPQRQQTLRDTISWSYALLDPAEQALFATLSVFRGGASLEAVEQVYVEPNAMDLLRSLVAKSLVLRSQPAGQPVRFWLLETVREFAAGELQASGKQDAVQRRHAATCTVLAEEAAYPLRGGPAVGSWLQRLETEHDNIRAALRWSFAGGDEQLGALLVGALGHFWWRADHHQEGWHWTRLALERSASLADPLRAGVLMARGRLACALHESKAGKEVDAVALAIYRRLGDVTNTGWSLLHVSDHSIGFNKEYEAAVAACSEGLAILRELDDRPGIAQGLNILGELARVAGDYETAMAHYQACMALAVEMNDLLRQSMIHLNYAFIHLRRGEYKQAEARSRQSLQLELERGPGKRQAAAALGGLAGALGGQGEVARAVRLIGVAEWLFEVSGSGLEPGDREEYERVVRLLQEQTDEAAFAAWLDEGRALGWEGITYALQSGIGE